MKKTIALITAAVMSFALTACDNGSQTNSVASGPSAGTTSSAAQSSVNTQSSADVQSSANGGSETSGGVAGITSTNSLDRSQSTGDFTYKTEDGGIEITGSTVTAEDVVIPSEIDGKRVVSIGGNPTVPMFPNAKTITLPATLEEIDDYAFANCSALTEITIPASVEDIDDHAFMNCAALSSVTFSEGLQDIGDGAFSGCTSLLQIDLPDSVQEIEPTSFDTSVKFTLTYRGTSYSEATIGDLYKILR